MNETKTIVFTGSLDGNRINISNWFKENNVTVAGVDWTDDGSEVTINYFDDITPNIDYAKKIDAMLADIGPGVFIKLK